MYKENISYEDKVDLMADMWAYDFHHEMSQDQIKDFDLYCKLYEVNVIDVLLVMANYQDLGKGFQGSKEFNLKAPFQLDDRGRQVFILEQLVILK